MKDKEFKIDRSEIKVRKSWPENFQPETKVERVKTDYKRSDTKRLINETMEAEEAENGGPDIDWLP